MQFNAKTINVSSISLIEMSDNYCVVGKLLFAVQCQSHLRRAICSCLMQMNEIIDSTPEASVELFFLKIERNLLLLDVTDFDPVVDAQVTELAGESVRVSGWHHDVHRPIQMARHRPKIHVMALLVQPGHGVELVPLLGHHLQHLVPGQSIA